MLVPSFPFKVIAEDDMVAARFTMRGTHDGPFSSVSPTGKTIQVRAMNLYRLSNEQLFEEYGRPDMLALLQQIRAVPKYISLSRVH